MIGCRAPSSFGNLAGRLRKEDCAAASLFCEESCPARPPAVFSVASGALRVEGGGAAAVRARAGGAAAGSLGCGSSEIGPLLRAAEAVAAFGAAGAALGAAGGAVGRGAAAACTAAGWLVTRFPLTSDASGGMTTVRTLFGSVHAPAPCPGATGAGHTKRGAALGPSPL